MNPSARRVAQRYLGSKRVASRWCARMAGLMQAPPAMHEAILDWVLAVVAANTSQAIDTEIKRVGEQHQFLAKGYETALKGVAELRASPTSWKVYKEFVEVMDRWGGQPYSRRSVKDFQKLTPERREALLDSISSEVDRAEELIKLRQKSLGAPEALLEEQRSLAKFKMPGVSAMSDDEVSKKFDIDTSGWRYGTPEYLTRLDEALENSAHEAIRGIQEMIDRAVQSDDPHAESMSRFLQQEIDKSKKMIESGNFPGWKEITVTLARKPVRSEQAFWSPLEKTVRIVIPDRARPYQLSRLGAVLEHELVHFAQSWLSAIAGHTVHDLMKSIRQPAGMPSRSLQTPEFRQHMDPQRATPEAAQEAKKVLRKLQQVGVNPRLVNWHDLDDIEFYSELGDAVRDFQQAWDRADLADNVLRPAIRHFTFSASKKDWDQYAGFDGTRYGPLFNFPRSKFFQALKTVPSARGKYERALAEFVKAVL